MKFLARIKNKDELVGLSVADLRLLSICREFNLIDITGKLLEVAGTKVAVKLPNGKEVALPLSLISDIFREDKKANCLEESQRGEESQEEKKLHFVRLKDTGCVSQVLLAKGDCLKIFNGDATFWVKNFQVENLSENSGVALLRDEQYITQRFGRGRVRSKWSKYLGRFMEIKVSRGMLYPRNHDISAAVPYSMVAEAYRNTPIDLPQEEASDLADIHLSMISTKGHTILTTSDGRHRLIGKRLFPVERGPIAIGFKVATLNLSKGELKWVTQ